MNTTYLNTEQINTLTRLCEETLSKSTKARLKELSEKFNMTFKSNKQENLNQVWQFIIEEMSKNNTSRTRTGETFSEAIRKFKIYGGTGYISDYVQAIIENQYKKDYDFIRNFKPDELVNSISEIIRTAGLPNDINFTELIEVSNYEKYFKSLYGIENCTKESLKATDNFIKWAESVTTGVKNKDAFLWALNVYLTNPDKTAIHTILHK